MNEIGARIKQKRMENNMTLEELGKKVGAGPSTVRKWEEGIIKNMKASKLADVAKALGTTPGELMGYSNDTLARSGDMEILIEVARGLDAEHMQMLLSMAENIASMQNKTRRAHKVVAVTPSGQIVNHTIRKKSFRRPINEEK